mgnify:CR=1 FL=1
MFCEYPYLRTNLPMNKKTTPRNQMTGFRMLGGIDVDETTLDDNANYWAQGARGARESIMRLLIETNTSRNSARLVVKAFYMLSRFWVVENTWKTICLKTEHFLELLRKMEKTK